MKIKGLDTLNYKIPVELKAGNRSIIVEIDPMPFDFYSKISKELPDPQPPKVGFLKDEQKRWQRDENGHPLIEYNFQDEVYKAKLAENSELQNIALVYEAIKNCSEFSFETKKEGKQPKDFYIEIRKEMEQAGFKMKHFKVILEAIKQDNNFAIIEEEKKSF